MKLAIISHTEHYKQPDGAIVGWGPTVSEINHLAQDFKEIYHIAFLFPGAPPPSSLPYTSANIKFVPLTPIGGKGIVEKIKIILNIPKIISVVQKTLNRVDAFQLRTPTGMGVFLIPYLTLFSNKKGWYKYAGNWNQENPPMGYALQRWMLKQQKRKVTINGRWPNQPKHCLTFGNPCLTEEERREGSRIIEKKSFEPPYTFCFVGRLEDAKGVQRIIDAFGGLNSLDNVAKIHFIGNGEKRNLYEKECKMLQLPATFYGFLERGRVFEIYKKSHFILLPSTASEGFPKVIAEAMNFGCLPMVSNVSGILQYVRLENGFIIDPCTSAQLYVVLEELFKTESLNFKNRSIKSHWAVIDFTFDHYRKKIQTEILKTPSI